MEITITTNIQSFPIPNSVFEGYDLKAPAIAPPQTASVKPLPLREYLLSELTSETLDTLCDNFKNVVFEKAGKQQPDYATQSFDLNQTQAVTLAKNLTGKDWHNLTTVEELICEVLYNRGFLLRNSPQNGFVGKVSTRFV